ncbi:MAG: VPLPA-CTERM sorting domain-containing protein [Gammaproteobacteria bacterium]|nr:VPLPA-CTERM sorting domain-containing protein [Gammaproteobacteria bacterium]
MIKKILATLAIGLLLVASANAATVRGNGTTSTVTISGPAEVNIGDSFSLSLLGDGFLNGLGAGGLVLIYDPNLVQLDGVKLAPLPGLDAGFSCPGGANCPDLGPGNALALWGTFGANLLPDGFGKMADINFTAIGLGSAVFSMISFDQAGGWLDPFFSPLPTPGFNEFKVNIVPLPAAVWFMIGGLASLMGFRRKK